jgi:hypothetical protein
MTAKPENKFITRTFFAAFNKAARKTVPLGANPSTCDLHRSPLPSAQTFLYRKETRKGILSVLACHSSVPR